ncbi:hypothetical protein BDF14DRAFT_1717049 [Spinellus fusiger]|nr:hypothetical protein BDF14DRAFT_1717049 [Spinellus fusiger]
MPFTLLIPSPHFITSLSNDVLENTNVRTLQMYLVWRTLWKYLDTLGEVYVAPRRKLMAKINGIEARAKPMRWNTCLSHLDQSLGLLMGHYFVRSLDKDSKAKSEELASKIAESFVDSLSHLAWVDDTTRQEMVAKVQAIHYQLGYPTSSPDILSLVALSEFYSNVNIVQDSLFANVQSANRWKVKQQWAQLGKPVVHGIWKANPQDVQAYYTRQQNEMIVPAGLLQPPFYNAQGPEYLNYGSLGWMVGQNILHGFDPVGRHYNGQGELGHWWSDSSLVGFDNRTSCFAKQYSEFTLEGPRGELYSVDGQRTLNANLADNGALKKAYAAWLLRFESKHYNNSPLPGLEQWTVEQLFYINFGRMACSKSTSENDVREIRTSETAPDKWRVNGPLINSPHFSKVFQCPLGSPMNPVVKCNLW